MLLIKKKLTTEIFKEWNFIENSFLSKSLTKNFLKFLREWFQEKFVYIIIIFVIGSLNHVL
jgi:hypothetical protein